MVSNTTLTHEASRGRDDAVVTGLVARARNGERQAWEMSAPSDPGTRLRDVPGSGRHQSLPHGSLSQGESSGQSV